MAGGKWMDGCHERAGLRREKLSGVDRRATEPCWRISPDLRRSRRRAPCLGRDKMSLNPGPALDARFNIAGHCRRLGCFRDGWKPWRSQAAFLEKKNEEGTGAV